MASTGSPTEWRWRWRRRRCGCQPPLRSAATFLTVLTLVTLVASATFLAEGIPLAAHAAVPPNPSSVFHFTTTGAPTAGQAAAVNTAASILSRVWVSAVPVEVRVAFRPLDEAATLAHTVNGRSLAVGGVPYPLAAAAALTGHSVCGAAEAAASARGIDGGVVARGTDGCPYDVDMVVNTRQQWYAPDPRAASTARLDRNEYDLVSVLLHETFHAMLLSGKVVYVGGMASMSSRQAEEGAGAGAGGGTANTTWEDGGTADAASGGSSSGGTPRVGSMPSSGRAYFHGGTPGRFDTFLSDARGCAISSYLTDRALQASTGLDGPALLAAALTHNSLYFAGPAAAADGSPTPPLARLNGQRVYSSRASVYHLDEATYGSALMTPLMPRGRAVRELSPTLRRIQALVLDAAVPGAAVCASMGDPRSPKPGPPELSATPTGGESGGVGDAAATVGGDGTSGESTLLGMPLPVGIGVLVAAAVVLTVGAVLAARGGVAASRRSRRRSRRRRRASRRRRAGRGGGGVEGGRVHKRRSDHRQGGGRAGRGRASARAPSARLSRGVPEGV